MGPGARQAIIILIAMVLLLATGIVPPAVSGLLAAGAIVLSGIMNVEQAYRAIGWTTVILVGAMMPLSTAMVETGAAKLMAEHLVNLVGDAGPVALLAGLFILTAVMGQLISNTATALIVIPIGVAAADGDGHLAPSGAHEHGGGGGSGVPDADRHADEPDGYGPGRLCLQRLLEARLAAADLVLCGFCFHRAVDLAFLRSPELCGTTSISPARRTRRPPAG